MNQLSKKATAKIISEQNPSIDRYLKHLLNKNDQPYNPFLLSSGEILLYDPYDEISIIYKSQEELLKILLGSELNQRHIVKGMIKDPKKFLNKSYSMEIPKEIGDVLNIEDSLLNYSFESLKVVENALNGLEYDHALEEEIFFKVVIYIGETIRKIKGGKWILRKEENLNVWEPLIKGKDGKVYNPWLSYYKEMVENHPKVCLEGILRYELSGLGL